MRRRILYIVPPSPVFAGIERVIDEIASKLSTDYSNELDINVYFSTFYENIGQGRPYRIIQGNISKLRYMAKDIYKVTHSEFYDVIICPQIEPFVFSCLATVGTKSKIVLYLHGNFNIEMNSFRSRILLLLFRIIAIRKLSAVFAVAPGQLASFDSRFKRSIKSFWLPNPIRSFKDFPVQVSEKKDFIQFVNVGRLCKQKGQDLLIRSFSECYKVRQDIRLVLVGHGGDELYLRQLIEQNGVKEVVNICFSPNDPSEILQKSDIYVSSSRWEGWSLAICEALRFGLPIISTDCDFGPRDILVDDRLGKLVPNGDTSSLSATMLEYASNIDFIKNNADFRRSYVSRFDINEVISIHAKTIASL